MTTVHIAEVGEKEVRESIPSAVDRRFFLDRLQRRGLRRGKVLFAYEGGRLMGYVYLRLESADERTVRRWLPRTPLLQRLRVLEPYRRQGIGRDLVTAAEDLARRGHRRRIALGVDLDDRQLVPFYTRMGYREWRHGFVETYRELQLDNGTWRRQTEFCRIFVKDL